MSNPDKLIQLALNRPMEDMPKLCENNPDLILVCESEFFWKQRIAKDFPAYQKDLETLRLPRSLTYREYYIALSHAWNTLTKSGKHLFTEIPARFTGDQMKLIYAVPRFDFGIWKGENTRVLPDAIVYSFLSQDMVIVAFTANRKLITGSTPPGIQSAVIVNPDLHPNKNLVYMAEGVLMNKGIEANWIYLVYRKDWSQFARDASSAGYMQLSEEAPMSFDDDIVFDNSKRLARGVKMEEYKPVPRPKDLPGSRETATPEQKNRIKKLFSFMS